MRLPQGGLKRISASVLVDQNLRWEGVGPKAKRILEPPSPEKLKAIRDLVAAAIGFDADSRRPAHRRNAAVRVDAGDRAAAGARAGLRHRAPPYSPMRTAGMARNALVGQKNVVDCSRCRSRVCCWRSWPAVCSCSCAGARRTRKQVEMAGALPRGSRRQRWSAGEDPAERRSARARSQACSSSRAEQARLEAEALNSLKLPPVTTKKSEVLSKHIAETVKKDPVTAAQILRTWLDEDATR